MDTQGLLLCQHIFVSAVLPVLKDALVCRASQVSHANKYHASLVIASG